MKTRNTFPQTLRFLHVLVVALAALCLVQPAPAALIGQWVAGPTNLADTSGFTPAGTHDGVAVGPGAVAYSNDVPAGFSGSSLVLMGDTNVAVMISNSATSDPGYTNTFDNPISNQFTIAFWGKRLPPPAWRPWVSKGGEGGGGWQFRRRSSQNFACFTIRGIANEDGYGSTFNVNTDIWHHFAGVWDQASSNRIIYIDGVVSHIVTNNPSETMSLSPSNHLVLAGRQTDGLTYSAYYYGQMYDVRMYNTALSSNEVRSVMTGTPEAHMLTFGLPGMPAVIAGTNIDWTVPYGTAVTSLAPTFSLSAGATCNRTSGTTTDFSTPQTYTVISSDYLITNIYTVTVTVTPASTAKNILTLGPGAVITGTNIAWTVPFGTDVTNLAPTYTVSQFASGAPPSGTSRNFSSPQTYTVTAQDLSSQDYVVTVTVTPPSTVKDILTFGPGAVITGTNITWKLPYGTDVTALSPTYTVSPLAAGAPPSGTSRDFTSPQTYTVTAQDLSTKEYVVTVTVLSAPINVNYYGGSKPGNADMDSVASDDPTARGSASRVAPHAYVGTNWNDISPSGANDSEVINSLGETTTVRLTSVGSSGYNDWNGLGTARMLVSGAMASYASYTPVFTLAGLSPSNAYDIYIASQERSNNRPVDFRAGSITRNVQYAATTDWGEGTNYARLASVIPDPNGQVVVAARKGTPTLDYYVVNGFQVQDMGPRGMNQDAFIYSFDLPGLGAATVNGTNIVIAVPSYSDLTALSPTYVASVGATVDKPSGSTWNFSGPVSYTVVSEDASTTNQYMVTVTPLVITAAALDVSAAGTGLDILNDGIFVAANHFGGVSDGMLAAAPVTLTNGLTFGTNTWHMTSGWTPMHSTSTDAHGNVPLITDTDFGTLMHAYFWIAYGNSVSHMTIPGLTPGHTYRLQLVSPNPQYCTVSVEGSAPVAWTNVPSVLIAAWTAKDDTANAILSRTAGEIDFNAYALHDISALTPFIDITNIIGITNVPSDTTSIDIIGTNNEFTVDMWWSNSGGGAGTLNPVPGQWNFAVTPLALGANLITVSGSNAVGIVHSDSVTVNVIPEPAAAAATAAVWCCLLAARKRTR